MNERAGRAWPGLRTRRLPDAPRHRLRPPRPRDLPARGGRGGGPAAREQNARELRGGSATARAGAAEELGRSGRAERSGSSSRCSRTRRLPPLLAAAAAHGLGMAGDRTAVGPLEAALFGRPASVSEAAAWALGRIGDPQAAGSLADLGSRAPSRLAASAVAALDGFPPYPPWAWPCARNRAPRHGPGRHRRGRGRGPRQGRRLPRAPPRRRGSARRGDEAIAGLAALGALASRPTGSGRPPRRRSGCSPEARTAPFAARPRVPWGSLRSRRPSPPCSGASPR